MNVKDFLKVKSRPVITIGPDETTYAAIQKLAENNIGALPVCHKDGELLGIITERDLLKECSQRNMVLNNTNVESLMTKEVAIALPEDDILYVMEVMTRKGIRHLPVMLGRKLIGVISARDLVEHQLEESRAKIRYLGDYLELVSLILKMDTEETS
jgi:CBS domain-containing protein